MNFPSRTIRLTPLDLVSVVFLLFLILLNILFHSRLPLWPLLVGVNIAVILVILFLAWFAERHPSPVSIGLHRWYCYPIVLFVFKEIYLMVRPIHPFDYDAVFIAVDHAIFGVHPTQWLSQFAHPVLTEILQIAYFSYYLLFIMLGVEIYRRRTIAEFDRTAFLVVYGFYLSYLGYFLMPGVGPRFTLHDFSLLSRELPGVYLTDWMRAFINAGESIPADLSRARELVQRDVFPSGHTQLTLITVFLAYRHRISTRWIMTVLAALLILATVYLRYHYVVDLFGGVAFFLFTIWSGDRMLAWWSRQHRGHAEVAPDVTPG